MHQKGGWVALSQVLLDATIVFVCVCVFFFCFVGKGFVRLQREKNEVFSWSKGRRTISSVRVELNDRV